MKRLIPFLLAIMTAGVVQAETRYISDTLFVPLRAGPGNEYRIVHRGLKTGTPLVILEEANAEDDDGYTKVRTFSGNEGYIPDQYLLKEEPAKDQLARVRSENSELVLKNTEYRTQLAAFESKHRQLTDNLNTGAQKIRKLEQELSRIREVSANSMEIDSRNKTLVTYNEELKVQLNTLQAENQQMSDSTQQRWYLYGALTLLTGTLLGLFGPLLKPKKKSSWT